MLLLYADHCLDGKIVSALRAKDVDILTADEDGQRATRDPLLFERAISLGRVMVNHDRHMLLLGYKYQAELKEFPGLIFVRQDKIRLSSYIAPVIDLATKLLPDEM